MLPQKTLLLFYYEVFGAGKGPVTLPFFVYGVKGSIFKFLQLVHSVTLLAFVISYFSP